MSKTIEKNILHIELINRQNNSSSFLFYNSATPRGFYLIKGTRISFLHEEEGKYVLVDAVISNDTIFKVPKKKATKFIKENNTDYKPNLEKTLKEISTQLFQLNQKVNQPVNQNNSNQIGVKSAQPETLISPRLKRRAATPELIESEVELSNICKN
ncbi:hypothetical protein BpHYR1_030058 [Brachionus plicatilis]|uniref:Uncharacterized protein n=1 Tax=Brachionus plicatilis TaxID=10195 RepID=A0A3M7SMF3_BRAPC|nr:hypothetical protein BpHYR1_030058 [Brachionus plicatilis]